VLIDIFSDVVCPWCFIGKRRLEKALGMRPEIAPQIRWRAYQLNPDMPAEGMPTEEFFTAKFGGAERIDERRAAVIEAGRSAGIEFAFERIGREPNTRDAHRLIRHAADRGKAGPLVEALFQAHFMKGRDIGDRATLAAIAGDNGLDAAEARAFLDTERGAEAVLAEEEQAQRLGISAVPCYIFELQYAVAGAQEPEFFLPIFDLVQSGGKNA
jgi:predicted DsbA family dithiol-disulfide isomerase